MTQLEKILDKLNMALDENIIALMTNEYLQNHFKKYQHWMEFLLKTAGENPIEGFEDAYRRHTLLKAVFDIQVQNGWNSEAGWFLEAATGETALSRKVHFSENSSSCRTRIDVDDGNSRKLKLVVFMASNWTKPAGNVLIITGRIELCVQNYAWVRAASAVVEKICSLAEDDCVPFVMKEAWRAQYRWTAN